jgi:SAM-dependent methyltransferase
MISSCLICGSSRSQRLFETSDPHYGIPGKWWVRRCGDCQSFFLEDPPAPEQLADMYPSDAYYSFQLSQSSRWKQVISRIVRYPRRTREPAFDRPGRILDFGCGAGEFLLKMRGQGWECAGVEISAKARDVARENGMDVRPEILGASGFDEGSFDYVRANHSLEHVHDPSRVLSAMFKALKPGGTLFIGVPTTSSQNARVFGRHWWYVTPPLHQSVPSTSGMIRLLERTGFRVGRVETNSDSGGTAGSLQVVLNRHSVRRANQGIIFQLKPLLLLGQWIAMLQDRLGVGDKLEIVATKPARP